MLISIDGIDGCGKSTQVNRLAEDLGAQKVQEISDSVWGRRLRALDSPTLAQQLAYFTADRAGLAELLTTASGSPTVHIVSDRSYLSSVAYQSYDTGLKPSLLEEIGLAIVPPYDLQIVLTLPVDVALQRVQGRGEKLAWCENAGLLTWAARVFATWAAKREHIVLADATQTPDEVFVQVRALVDDLFRKIQPR